MHIHPVLHGVQQLSCKGCGFICICREISFMPKGCLVQDLHLFTISFMQGAGIY